MICEEKQAKEKRCCGPQTAGAVKHRFIKLQIPRAGGPMGATQEATAQIEEHWCLGSDCMGWVWIDPEGRTRRRGMCGAKPLADPVPVEHG